MKFTLNWLKEYIDLDLPAEIVADRLTMLGLEVDNITELHGELEQGIRVARIINVRPHPDADRLTLCDVSAAQGNFAFRNEDKESCNPRPGIFRHALF